MDKLEIKWGFFIQQTQYFIPVKIDLSIVLARLGISDFFTCPVGQPEYNIYLSDVSFHWYRTNVNVEACLILPSYPLSYFLAWKDVLKLYLFCLSLHVCFISATNCYNAKCSLSVYVYHVNNGDDSLNCITYSWSICLVYDKYSRYI